MTPRGDCPESLRRTALSWALSRNEEVRLPGRLDYRHLDVVYANFSDVFASRDEFDRLVARRQELRRRGDASALRQIV
jgi:hypothetical protein